MGVDTEPEIAHGCSDTEPEVELHWLELLSYSLLSTSLVYRQ
jgi:hypothetical protein